MKPMYWLIPLVPALLVCADTSLAAEDARVMPSGVRRIQMRTVNAVLLDRRDHNGNIHDLGAPFARRLTFNDLAAQSSGVEQSLLRGFMLAEGFDTEATAGQFAAEVRGGIRAIVPSFAVGLNDRWTVGFGVPIYSASTSTKIGFVVENRVADLAARLSQSGNTSGARQLIERINRAPEAINLRLQEAGYDPLGDWQSEGIGDLNLQAKFSHRQRRHYAFASKWSLIAPTGQIDDPNQVGDIEFGEGVWAAGYAMIGDLYLTSALQWSTSVGVLVKGQDRRPQRFRTNPDDLIASKLAPAEVDVGDEIQADSSLQFLDLSGFFASVGLLVEKSYPTKWKSLAGDEALTIDGQTLLNSEIVIGWNTTRRYLRGKSRIPGSIQLTMADPLSARNAVTASRVEVDCRIFF